MARVVALASVLDGCAAISGLDSYDKSECVDCDADASRPDGAQVEPVYDADAGTTVPEDRSEPVPPSDARAGTEADAAEDISARRDATSSEVDAPADARTDADARAPAPDADARASAPDAGACGAQPCPTSSVSRYACPVGGCNASGGACAGALRGCSCSSDAQCPSGSCVKVTGQNDVACGTSCTGVGVADGLGCALKTPGIPTLAPSGFGYAPSNFNPASYALPAAATRINCNTTYNSSTHVFTGWCAGQTPPTITANVAQPSGPAVDVLAFSSLVIDAGATLTLTSSGGGNAVIFAIYGNANIQGGIHADGAVGVSGTTAAGASGPGGNFSCTTSTGPSQPSDNRCSGGGGAGASAPGGSGAGGVSGDPVAGGVARPRGSLTPLYGGCAGGTSGSWSCRTSGGGGGGAVQISTAGALTITGAITANGGAGGTSTCFTNSACAGPGYGGGGGGAGSGGAILLEGQSVTSTGAIVSAVGGKGGTPNTGGGGGTAPGGMGGPGGTTASPAGGNGTGADSSLCGPYTECGGGGGGAYGYVVVSSGKPGPCATTLSPSPVPNPARSACICVADSNCASGKCVNAHAQCTATCTGSGAADSADCQLLQSSATAWSCAVGNCNNVAGPTGVCNAASVACWCTSDSQCQSGRCASWAGCPAGGCTGTGASDGFHCTP